MQKLSIQHCHSYGADHNSNAGSVPGPGTSTCHNEKKKKKKKISIISNHALKIPFLPPHRSYVNDLKDWVSSPLKNETQGPLLLLVHFQLLILNFLLLQRIYRGFKTMELSKFVLKYWHYCGDGKSLCFFFFLPTS